MEREVKMAAKMYAAREAAKFILGDKYVERMKSYGQVVQAVMDARHLNVLPATIEIVRKADAMEALYVLAAAVEMIEPSGLR